MLKREFNLPNWKSTFWIDSTAMLQMIVNANERFPVFVANRLTKSEEHTTSNQWRYVPSKENPAGLATRGIETKSFISKTFWFVGPKFLLEREDLRPQPPCSFPNLPEEFLVLKKSF